MEAQLGEEHCHITQQVIILLAHHLYCIRERTQISGEQENNPNQLFMPSFIVPLSSPELSDHKLIGPCMDERQHLRYGKEAQGSDCGQRRNDPIFIC